MTSISSVESALKARIDETLEGCLKGRASSIVKNEAYTHCLNMLLELKSTFQKDVVEEIERKRSQWISILTTKGTPVQMDTDSVATVCLGELDNVKSILNKFIGNVSGSAKGGLTKSCDSEGFLIAQKLEDEKAARISSETVSLCKHCSVMTHTVTRLVLEGDLQIPRDVCGKCGAIKLKKRRLWRCDCGHSDTYHQSGRLHCLREGCGCRQFTARQPKEGNI